MTSSCDLFDLWKLRSGHEQVESASRAMKIQAMQFGAEEARRPNVNPGQGDLFIANDIKMSLCFSAARPMIWKWLSRKSRRRKTKQRWECGRVYKQVTRAAG